MNTENENSFDWRAGGFRMEMESNVSSLIKVKDDLLCITKNDIRSIITADLIDPEKTNPDIRHSQQIISPHGSDNIFVGGILQQADELFKNYALPKDVNYQKGIDISFDFLIEILSLNSLIEEYTNSEKEINDKYDVKPKNDGSIEIPSIKNLDQKVKEIITSADHSVLLIIELVRFFYPDIKNKNWCEQLSEKIKLQIGDNCQELIFINSFKSFIGLIRDIRNKIEHPDITDILIISNYKITPAGVVKPTIYFKNNNNEIEESISKFSNSIVNNIFNIFQSLMAILCSINAKTFAGDRITVVEIPDKQRKDNEKHVRFKYEIILTK